VQAERALRGVGWDVETFVGEGGRQPQGFPFPLSLVHVGLAATHVHQDEPHEAGPRDEPGDEQPPVELGVHRREV